MESKCTAPIETTFSCKPRRGKIYAFTATLPGRAGIAKQAIESILPQVDRVQVVLNNFSVAAMTILVASPGKVTFTPHDNSLADGSRFINVDRCPPGYVLVFDDDIIYPPDYVQRLIAVHKQTGGFVSPMGKILHAYRPLRSYYEGIEVAYRAFANVAYNARVEVPGACGILWHNSEVRVGVKDMLIPNSDLCLAKYAKDNAVPCTVMAHSADYLTNLWTGEVTKEESIYGKYRRRDQIQTDFVNKWL